MNMFGQEEGGSGRRSGNSSIRQKMVMKHEQMEKRKQGWEGERKWGGERRGEQKWKEW